MILADLQPALAEVAETGVAVVPAAVDWTPLPAELATLRYVEPPEGAHPMTTHSELAVLDSWDAHPALTLLHKELVTQLAVPAWTPNQIFVRRYRDGSEGMTPHRDGSRFRLLVATLTVVGDAQFFHHNETGEVVTTWSLAPGDLVLLRGPGLTGDEDGRPHHSVSGPAGSFRCSVAFRMSKVVV
jgi:hypothetical protein